MPKGNTNKSWYEHDLDDVDSVLLNGDEWRVVKQDSLKISFEGFSFVDDTDGSLIRGPITSIVALDFGEQ